MSFRNIGLDMTEWVQWDKSKKVTNICICLKRIDLRPEKHLPLNYPKSLISHETLLLRQNSLKPPEQCGWSPKSIQGEKHSKCWWAKKPVLTKGQCHLGWWGSPRDLKRNYAAVPELDLSSIPGLNTWGLSYDIHQTSLLAAVFQ